MSDCIVSFYGVVLGLGNEKRWITVGSAAEMYTREFCSLWFR